MKRKVYLDDLPLEEALRIYRRHLRQVGALKVGAPETIPAEQALARVTAAPVYAANSSPHYHASAMDGMAVQSADTYGASETRPVRLALGREAIPVDTGDPLPAACDAVIMIEDVHFVDANLIEILHPATPWQHIRAVGEDIVATEMILPANHQIRPIDLGAFLAAGVTEVRVHPKPKVAILPTGTELVQPGVALEPGQIVEFNSRIFAGMVTEWGGEPLRWEITPDEPASLQAAISAAVQQAEVVLINAGSSAGSEDYTAGIIQEMGRVLAHGVAIKPGKPVILGEIQGKPVIGLPGYPVSSYLIMDLFVQPLILTKIGLVEPEKERIQAAVSRKLASSLGVEEFVRVKLGQVGERIVATPITRGAGVLTSLIRADGIIRVPRLSEGFNAGEAATVELLRPLREIENTTVLIGSHDITLDVLANYLRLKYPAASLSSAHVGSMGGLSAILRGEAHCAGVHLLDAATGVYNVTYIQRLLPNRKVVLLNLVYRAQGLIVAAGNPKNIRGLEDLLPPGVTYVNRQRGSGTRLLLDYELDRAGLDAEQINGYEHEEFTHMAVAVAVKSGSADAGLGIQAAAQALGLDFIFIGEECYDLCIPEEFLATKHITRLQEIIQLPEFKAEVMKLGGYDLRRSGEITEVRS